MFKMIYIDNQQNNICVLLFFAHVQQPYFHNYKIWLSLKFQNSFENNIVEYRSRGWKTRKYHEKSSKI